MKSLPLGPRALLLLSLGVACGVPDREPPGAEAEAEAASGGSTSSPGMTSTSGPPAGTSGEGTSTGLDSGSTEASSTGTVFIPNPPGCAPPGPDGSTWHCTLECSVVAQDCDVDEKCMPWGNDGGPSWNASRCSPLDPAAAAPGEPCTVMGSAVSGIDDCALGSMCWAVDPETLQGTCIAFCDPEDADACDAPQRCVPLNDGEVPVCLSPCNPLQANACPEGEACRLVTGPLEFSCVPLQGGVVQTSAVCAAEICDPASTCVGGRVLPGCGGSCCTPWCDLADPEADAGCAALDPALACEPFFGPGPVPPGLETLGVCIGVP